MSPKRHVIDVVVEANGQITVQPDPLRMFKGEVVSWRESGDKPLSITFEDSEAFLPEKFILADRNGTGLIGNKVGSHPYKIAHLEESEGAEDTSSLPIIIIMDPSSSHQD